MKRVGRRKSMVTAIYEALILKRGIVTSCTTRYVDMPTHLINLHLWIEVDVRRVFWRVWRSQFRILCHVLSLLLQLGEGLVNRRQQVWF